MSILDKKVWTPGDLEEYRRMCEERAEAEWLASFPEEERGKAAEERLRGRLRACGVPERYLGADGHDLPGDGLYVFGKVGTGKTRLASGIARKWVSDGGTCIFATSVSVMDDLRNGGSMKPYLSTGLLIIDDMGKEAPTPWVLSQLWEIVNARYNSMSPMVITSNYGYRQLAERLAGKGGSETASAIVSRLCETCKVVALEGRDRRL